MNIFKILNIPYKKMMNSEQVTMIPVNPLQIHEDKLIYELKMSNTSLCISASNSIGCKWSKYITDDIFFSNIYGDTITLKPIKLFFMFKQYSEGNKGLWNIIFQKKENNYREILNTEENTIKINITITDYIFENSTNFSYQIILEPDFSITNEIITNSIISEQDNIISNQNKKIEKLEKEISDIKMQYSKVVNVISALKMAVKNNRTLIVNHYKHSGIPYMLGTCDTSHELFD